MKRLLASLGIIAALLWQTPVRATEVTTSQQYTQGQQVQAGDLTGDFEAVRNLSGILATLLLGTPNALPNNNPLAISLSSSATTFSVGGSGQFVIAQDVATSGNARLIDSCPQQTITIPANSSGSTRTDLLAIQYQQIPTNGHNVTFSDDSVRTVYNAVEGCAYSYNAGTSTPPAGYVGFASISVPAGFTNAGQATVTYLFSTVSSLLLAQLGAYVSTVNGASGPITIAAGSGVTVANSGGTVTIASTASAPVSSLNSLTGALTVTNADSSITVTSTGTTISIKANFPTVVNGVNAQSGNVTIAGGVGNSVSTASGTVTVTNTGVTSIAAGTGIHVSGSTGGVMVSGFSSSSGTHVESATCSASTTAGSGYWYCTATFPGGASFTGGYLCATSFSTGNAGAAGYGAPTGWYRLSSTQVELYQNQTSGGVVTAVCLG